ncbi:MAG TPA: PA14 domain-containing protein, partial [Armatimonadota bacterium]|nr:PA14 domain-containing protein [Armatimonadota bacterium]
RVLFNSPIGEVYFDEVRDISDEVQLWQQGGNYLFSVPLATVGLTAEKGRTILADLGVLRGNGVQTVQRVYWNNLDTGIVSDIPSEARLRPGNWGAVRFQPLTAIGKQQDAVTPAKTERGISYAYYEGAFTRLPNFSTLTPKKTGTVGTFTLDPHGQADNYAFVFTGYLRVPTDGIYTFTTSSDDGSRLFIGDTLVVNNDFTHGLGDVEGYVTLKAGWHPIRVEYFQATGGSGLSVTYQGPGMDKTPIPAEALAH